MQNAKKNKSGGSKIIHKEKLNKILSVKKAEQEINEKKYKMKQLKLFLCGPNDLNQLP
jgi:hypothetical protein